MVRGSQCARQWRLLQFLGRPEGLAVEDAARQLRCAIRTIWRDLRVLLQDAGFLIYDERDGRRGRWKVEKTFLDRLPIPLSLPEVVAVEVVAPSALREAICREAERLVATLAPVRERTREESRPERRGEGAGVMPARKPAARAGARTSNGPRRVPARGSLGHAR